MKLGETVRSYMETSLLFASGSPTSNAISANAFGLGNYWLPSGFTGLALGVMVAPAGGEFSNLPDHSNAYGTDVSNVLPTAQLAAQYAGAWPGYWFAAGATKLLSHDGSGSGIPQTSARIVRISIKS